MTSCGWFMTAAPNPSTGAMTCTFDPLIPETLVGLAVVAAVLHLAFGMAWPPAVILGSLGALGVLVLTLRV